MLLTSKNEKKNETIVSAKSMRGDKHAGGVFETDNNGFGGGLDILGWFFSLSFFQKILIIGFSLLFFSPLGINYLLVYQGTFVGDPLLVVTIGCCFLLYKGVRNTVNELLNGTWRKISFLILLMLFFEGAIFLDIAASLTDFRCAILIFVSYLLCSSKNSFVRYNFVSLIGITSIVSILSHAIFFLTLHDGDSIKNMYPSYGFFLLAFISMYEKKPWVLFLMLIVSTYVAATSFYRALMVLPLLFMFLIIIRFLQSLRGSSQYLVLRNRKHMPIYIGFFVIMTSTASASWGLIMDHLNSSEGAVAQGIRKINNILLFLEGKGLGEGDDLRAQYLDFIYTNFGSFLLPSGFGHKALINHWGPIWTTETLNFTGANSLDGMHLFFACHFGLILTFIIFVYLFTVMARATFKMKGPYFISYVTIILFIAVNAFANASPFALLPNAVFCGAVFGVLSYYHKTK